MNEDLKTIILFVTIVLLGGTWAALGLAAWHIDAIISPDVGWRCTIEMGLDCVQWTLGGKVKLNYYNM